MANNCKYSEHVRAYLIKANKCLFVLRSLRKEVSVKAKWITYLALQFYRVSLMVCLFMALQTQISRSYKTLLDRCFKRKYTSKRMDIRELLEKADRKLFKVRSVDPDCPLSNIIPKKKETKYLLRNKSAHRPDIKTDRFKNVFVNRIIFRYNL